MVMFLVGLAIGIFAGMLIVEVEFRLKARTHDLTRVDGRAEWVERGG